MTKENTLDPTERDLRDMFAMTALDVVCSALVKWYGRGVTPDEAAAAAYKLADAMLEERKK